MVQLKMKKLNAIPFLVTLQALVAIMIGCAYLKTDTPPEMNEVVRIRSAFPVYPGMTQVPDDFKVDAPNIACRSLSFKSESSFEDVSRFYIKELTSTGWELTGNQKLSDWGRDLGGHELEFRKGEYHIAIEKGGSNNDDWDYGVTICWKKP
jgi:hypothetical protein